MGKKNGVAQQTLKEHPKALITHCQGHSLSLSGKDVNKQCRIFSETMGTTGKVIALIKFSPKSEQILGTINENIEVFSDSDIDVFEKVSAQSKLSVTRWIVCVNAFNKVNRLYLYLRTYFCIFSIIYFSILFNISFRVWQRFFFVCSIYL